MHGSGVWWERDVNLGGLPWRGLYTWSRWKGRFPRWEWREGGGVEAVEVAEVLDQPLAHRRELRVWIKTRRAAENAAG